ncbi:FAD-binding protein [Xanthomonas theicola]|uniref:FAD-linked oxidoreductase n=1 Tax=Xanthomonas theicola TaxID=56464 RepID=A0A2S6ZFF8_9XANT|nr:FAD-binding protein [Xanthomonas theicola]PPT90926.1 FAD-linked oxidoreductase [Xanthomonas theicola]QNH23619.1 FAD-binding oxidoreductase [Xanthomonas theicola]
MLKRRDFLTSGVALAGVTFIGAPCSVMARQTNGPATPDWPVADEWRTLSRAVGGRLAPVIVPDVTDPAVTKLMENPFYVSDQPGLTQSSGWLDAWRSAPSRYVVKAESAADVAAAVRFARSHGVRLVVRGGGHSYFGASSAPDSLMIWTRPMNHVRLHDAFVSAGTDTPPVHAVSLGAGCLWMDAYKAVTVEGGRYVQGGGCTTVGVAGLVQGGGFGSFSKGFGTVASGLLEAEIVTADGEVRVVNAVRHPDLFWAIKGGGGGTFGVVTRLTLKTHDLPELFGGAKVAIRANSDAAYRRLLARFVAHYQAKLCNPHWGEQARATRSNTLEIDMLFQGLTLEEANAAWRPLMDFVRANSDDYEETDPLRVIPVPARRYWDADWLASNLPADTISRDTRLAASPGAYWWHGDGEQVGAYWLGYQSTWLPASLLDAGNQDGLAEAWFAASRHWSVAFHFNKGLAGAPPEAIAASRDTATNPQMLSAFALAIIASSTDAAYPGQPLPVDKDARSRAAAIASAIRELRKVAPDAGTYVNECDFHQENWRQAFWGAHAARLEAIKRRYDDQHLFTVHHGIGSV